jgi:deazaflavin-dependent oxidoreductase (nitroreductase family)
LVLVTRDLAGLARSVPPARWHGRARAVQEEDRLKTGRRLGRTYETPVIAVQHDDSFLIARPYGERTDWLKNVLDKGSVAIVTNGHTYEVDRPEVIPMAEATAYFRPWEQRMHRQFHVDAALQIYRRIEAHR